MGIIATPASVEDWPTVSPKDAGLKSDLGARLGEEVAAGTIEGLHALLVLRGGRLAFEYYAEGDDERWGQPLPRRSHGPDRIHDVRSVTKSVVSLLYGIALEGGLVPPVTARLLDLFPQYPDLAADPLKRRMTVAHALTMRLGLAWKEDLAYSDPENGERQMEAAADRYRNVLERPMAHRPGAVWNYCGGATALLGHLIAKGAGLRLEDYAREVLFAPLGISDFEWINGSDGEAASSSGLRLKARDAARIGQLVLDHGQWRGRRIVSRAWLAASMRPRALVEKGLRYGYQWWLGRLVRSGRPWYGAFGNGGQRILVIPSLRMCVVIFAGNYNKADQWKMPVKVMTRVVMPSLLRG